MKRAASERLISSGDVSGLLQVTERDDELGLHALLDELGVLRNTETARNVVQSRTSRMLAGRSPDLRTRLHGVLAAREERPILSRVDADVLRHLGIDPLAACAMASLIGGELQVEDGVRNILAHVASTQGRTACRIHAVLRTGILWSSLDGLEVQTLPETIGAALPGRRLSNFASHPALDGHRLKVARVVDEGGRICIGVHAQRKALDADALLALTPIHND